MGNKNNRSIKATSANPGPGGGSDRRGARGNDSSVAPKVKSEVGKIVTATTLEEQSATKGNEIAATQSNQAAQLKFKSYKNGTLTTKNFEPMALTTQLEPLPAPLKALNARAASFIPKSNFANHSTSAMKSQDSFSLDRLKTLINDFPLDTKDSHCSANAKIEALNLNNTTLTTIPPFNPPTGPSRPAKTQFRRADLNHKDIVISASGVTRNLTRITRHFLQNGFPYWNRSNEFDPKVYDFLTVVKSMTANERNKLFREKQVEICIDIGLTDQEPAVYNAVPLLGDAGEAAEATVDPKFKGKETEVKKKVTGTRAIIDMIHELGPGFHTCTNNVTVTLIFPEDPTSPSRRSTSYTLITALVDELQSFTALNSLDINLKVHNSTNVRHDLSIQQLEMVLPFYDLVFEDWRVLFQKPYMQKPEEVRGWCIGYLDREMHKIMEARDRVLEEKTFVRYSVAPKSQPAVWRQRQYR